VAVRRGVVAGAIGLIGILASPAAMARPAQETPDPTDLAIAMVRQVCAAQWIDGVCEAVAYPDPGYQADAEPDTGQPLALRIGIVHDHSGYSDGDPTMRPSDYYAAARTGHNAADAGGDTGIKVDFMLSSDHSENEKLPITTAAVCLDPTDLAALLSCSNVTQADHYRKWSETLTQANAATEHTGDAYTGFTAIRGFEYTNDYYNHLGVYFSRNVVNAKLDGSYLTTEAFWNWLRTPADRGGGSDALVIFNHPGGNPALSPFDSDTPLNQLLQDTLGGANWHDMAYVPDADDQVVAVEVNGGDDLSWYVRALRNGWHVGPVANEDEHQREWSSRDMGKTLVLTRGRSPRDYYFALQHHRTVSIDADLVDGAPGTAARYPQISYWADGHDVDDPAATVLGAAAGRGTHQLELAATGLPAGAQAVLVSDALSEPRPFGTADASGTLRASAAAIAPASGEDWWFVVICQPSAAGCGASEDYSAVTAPIWLQANATAAAATAPTPALLSATPVTAPVPRASVLAGRLAATGPSGPSTGLGALFLALAAVGRISLGRLRART
jgi:hypothetical protein